MAGEEGVVRYQARDFGAAEQLVAEHGFSALVSVERGGDRSTVLYDDGLTPDAVARNLDVLRSPWVTFAQTASPPVTALITAGSRGLSGGRGGCVCPRRV